MKRFTTRRTVLYAAIMLVLTLCIASLLSLWGFELIISQLPLLLFLSFLLLLTWGLLSYKSKHFGKADGVLLAFWLLCCSTLIFHAFFSGYTYRSASRTTSAEQNSIIYATYNKLYTNDTLDTARNVLQAQNADIISFQEIRPDELDYYKQGLGLEYSAITTINASAEETEIGFLSRYPIIRTETLMLSPVNEVLKTVIALPSLGEVAVYSVHIFPPFSPDLYNASITAFTTLQERLADEDIPYLIAGDFNTTLYSPKLRALFQNVSSFSLASPQTDTGCTWFSYHLCMRIDHIFFSLPFSAADYRIAEPTGSDHRVVTTKLLY